MTTLIPTLRVRLFDHGYGREPLFVIETCMGFFQHWLSREHAVAICELHWLDAHKYRTFDEAMHDAKNCGSTAVVKMLKDERP